MVFKRGELLNKLCELVCVPAYQPGASDQRQCSTQQTLAIY